LRAVFIHQSGACGYAATFTFLSILNETYSSYGERQRIRTTLIFQEPVAYSACRFPDKINEMKQVAASNVDEC